MKNNILSKIKSTMSDRALVNHATIRELQKLWNLDLVELHCNLHPFDSFASTIRSALKKLDSTLGMRNTGYDCCVANMFFQLSNMRLDIVFILVKSILCIFKQ